MIIFSTSQRFLRHNTLTDIISFDFRQIKKLRMVWWVEIYISIPGFMKMPANSKFSKMEELHRVMAHGLASSLRLRDQISREIRRMRHRRGKCTKFT